MRRTCLGLAMVIAGWLLIGGATPAVATGAVSDCPVDTPRWEVSWVSDEAETVQGCGGEAEVAAVAGTDRGELPLTTGPAWVVSAVAGGLVGLGAGLFLVARRRRTIFTI